MPIAPLETASSGRIRALWWIIRAHGCGFIAVGNAACRLRDYQICGCRTALPETRRRSRPNKTWKTNICAWRRARLFSSSRGVPSRKARAVSPPCPEQRTPDARGVSRERRRVGGRANQCQAPLPLPPLPDQLFSVLIHVGVRRADDRPVVGYLARRDRQPPIISTHPADGLRLAVQTGSPSIAAPGPGTRPRPVCNHLASAPAALPAGNTSNSWHSNGLGASPVRVLLCGHMYLTDRAARRRAAHP